MSLPWDQAVAAGVCSQAEADMFSDCVEELGLFAYRFSADGLSDEQFDRLCTALSWLTSEGGVH